MTELKTHQPSPSHTAPPRPSRRLAFAIVPMVFALGLLGLWSLLADALFLDSPATIPASIPGQISPPSSARLLVPGTDEITLASHEANGEPAADAEVSVIDREESQRRLVVGRWQDDYRGRRYLTVRADGTATMIVEPSGIGKKLFAERLEFEIDWTFEDGRIVMTMTRGEPRNKAQLVLKLYGSRAEYSLLHLDEKQCLLLDADGQTQYDWRRIADDDRE